MTDKLKKLSTITSAPVANTNSLLRAMMNTVKEEFMSKTINEEDPFGVEQNSDEFS